MVVDTGEEMLVHCTGLVLLSAVLDLQFARLSRCLLGTEMVPSLPLAVAFDKERHVQLCTTEHGQKVEFLLIHMSTLSCFLETKFSCHLTKLTAISTSAYQAAYASLNYRILDLFDFDSKMFGSKELETWWSLVSSLQLQSNYRSPCRLQVHPFRPLGEFPSGKIPYAFVESWPYVAAFGATETIGMYRQEQKKGC